MSSLRMNAPLREISLASRRKRLQRAFEDAERVGDDQAVVGDRDTGALAARDPALHLAAVPHASAAVDHQLVRREVFREVVALAVIDLEPGARVLSEPSRNLHAADVICDGVMRACLRDEDTIAAGQAVDCESAFYLRVEIALHAR